ncbi:hypothetical protein A2U01_0088482, partial [Trifolium medium]|nr:hypothetical protein [Trifolium medium]
SGTFSEALMFPTSEALQSLKLSEILKCFIL